jgi:hypothetical protein
MGLAAYLGVFVLFALVPISSTRRLFGQLPAIAFWGGIPASVVLFVAAFFMNERKASVRTMLLAVFSGLLWFLAAFGSLAMLWGNN